MSLRKPAKTATTITIPNGTATSGTVNGSPGAAFGLVLPAALTSTTLTFQVSADGTNFQPLYDSSNAAISQTVAQGRSYQLSAALTAWPYWRVVGGSNEAADRSLIVVAQY